MKQYVIGGHGHVMVSYDSVAYEVQGLNPVNVPANMTVALFIPPGSEFGQKAGLELQTRVLFGGGLSDDAEIGAFVADIGRRTKRSKVVDKKNSFFAYDESKLAFPQLCTSADSKDLCDYNLQGPASGSDIHGFLWGAYRRTATGPVCLVDLHGTAKSRISDLLAAISADAGGEHAFVACVFCRVEVLDASAKAGLHPAVKTQQISLYTITD